MVPEVVTPLKLFATSKTMWTLPPLWTHRTRPQGFGNLAKNARFPQPPHRSLFSLTKRKNEEQNHSDQLSTESDHPHYADGEDVYKAYVADCQQLVRMILRFDPDNHDGVELLQALYQTFGVAVGDEAPAADRPAS